MPPQLKARRVGGQPLTVESDPAIDARYAEYKQLVARAVEVFGSDVEATRWLSHANPDFANRTPLQAFLEEGADSVLDVLGKIEHGVFF